MPEAWAALITLDHAGTAVEPGPFRTFATTTPSLLVGDPISVFQSAESLVGSMYAGSAITCPVQADGGET